MRNILLVVILMFSVASYGQKFGISLGLNSFNVSEHYIPSQGNCCKTSYSDELNYESVYGINFGGSVEFQLNKTLSVFSELQFSQKGYKVNSEEERYSSFNTRDYDRRLTLNYLELPIALKINIVKQSKWSPYALGGVYFAYLLRSKLQLEEVHSNFNSNPVLAIDPFDWGVRLGIGLQPGKFGLELNFVGGIDNTSPINLGNQLRTKNIGLNATLRYNING